MVSNVMHILGYGPMPPERGLDPTQGLQDQLTMVGGCDAIFFNDEVRRV